MSVGIRNRRHAWISVALLISAMTVGSGLAQESANYVMERITISAAAQRVSSLNLEMNVTFAQEGPVGAASYCNQGSVQNAGFWSIQGYSPVPVVLYAARHAGDPSLVDLTWSGSTSSFEVYRSPDPDGVYDPPNLVLTSSDCSATDNPPPAPIMYYLVIPIGP